MIPEKTSKAAPVLACVYS